MNTDIHKTNWTVENRLTDKSLHEDKGYLDKAVVCDIFVGTVKPKSHESKTYVNLTTYYYIEMSLQHLKNINTR